MPNRVSSKSQWRTKPLSTHLVRFKDFTKPPSKEAMKQVETKTKFFFSRRTIESREIETGASIAQNLYRGGLSPDYYTKISYKTGLVNTLKMVFYAN